MNDANVLQISVSIVQDICNSGVDGGQLRYIHAKSRRKRSFLLPQQSPGKRCDEKQNENNFRNAKFRFGAGRMMQLNLAVPSHFKNAGKEASFSGYIVNTKIQLK